MTLGLGIDKERVVPGTLAAHHQLGNQFAKHRAALMFWRDGQHLEDIAGA